MNMRKSIIDFNEKKGFICDMDGVIYHGNQILPGVPEFIQWLHDEKKEYLGANGKLNVDSIAETAKANQLKPYEYFEYLLTEIPKHMDETDRSFLDDLLPWSPSLPENIRK